MNNILDLVGYENLMHGITISEYKQAHKHLESLGFMAKFEPNEVIVIAYLCGIRQGVHNERAKRREACRTAAQTGELNQQPQGHIFPKM